MMVAKTPWKLAEGTDEDQSSLHGSIRRLERLSEELEKVGYELAGHLEALSVARLMLMSHETTQIAEKLQERLSAQVTTD